MAIPGYSFAGPMRQDDETAVCSLCLESQDPQVMKGKKNVKKQELIGHTTFADPNPEQNKNLYVTNGKIVDHVFHAHCFESQIKNDEYTCPICRNQVVVIADTFKKKALRFKRKISESANKIKKIAIFILKFVAPLIIIGMGLGSGTLLLGFGLVKILQVKTAVELFAVGIFQIIALGSAMYFTVNKLAPIFQQQLLQHFYPQIPNPIQ